MKKIPSVRMPDPKAGVIRSEHPRAVGPNGLVEAKNVILRDGSIQVRDGIIPVETPGKTLLGDVWSDEGGGRWSATLAPIPQSVWMDGTLGNFLPWPVIVTEEFQWTWDESSIWIYAVSDPNSLYTDPGVQWDSGTGSSAVIALASHDYQNEGSVVRDQLIAVLSDDIVCYNNDLSVARPVTEADTDWAWDGFYGPDATADDEWQKTQKISVDWTNIDWSQFTAETHGLGIRLIFDFYTTAGVDIELWEFDENGSTEIDVEFVLASGNSDHLSYTEYTQGVPYLIEDDSNNSTGIYIIFNDNWDSWYDEAVATGDSIASVTLYYCWAVYQASYKGLPGDQATVVDLGRTLRPVTRTWDYDQITHTLVAVEGKFMLDVDADSLASPPAPTVATCGDTGVCPRAKTIGIASQRIIAGNVSYFDSQVTAETARGVDVGGLEESNPAVVDWNDIVDQFAYFPDSVVYSGTVLTNGHKSWYPADILRLADTPGEVVASQEMGTQMIAIYKSDAIYTLSASTGPSPFAPSLRASGIQGPVSSRSVVALNDTTHLYLARDGGVYMFSGQSPQSLGDQFRTWIAREIDPEYAHLSFMQFDPERNEVHVYYPVKGSGGVVRKGMVIDVSKQPFTAWPVLWPKQVYNAAEDTLEDVDFLCAAMHFEGSQDIVTTDITIPIAESQGGTTKYQELYLGSENQPLAARSGIDDGRIFKTANIGNDFGVPIASLMETGTSDLGDPDNQKVLLELELLFDNMSDISGGTDAVLNVKIYGGDSNKSLSLLSTHSDVDMSSGQILIHPRVRARYFSVEIDLTAPMDEAGKWDTALGELEYYGAIARYKTSGVRQN